MTITLEQAKDKFELFRNQCIEVRSIFNTFKHLYESGDQVSAVLRTTAELFFSDLNQWMLELIILKIGRITDPAVTGKYENLTVKNLVVDLKDLGCSTLEVEELAQKISEFRGKIQPARHKLIVHLDIKTVQSGNVLGVTDEGDFDAFFSDLQSFTDGVAAALGLGPLDYSGQAGPGDVQDLIKALRKSPVRGS